MEIRDLRYFCLTAELEHVTNAAEKLGISQPFLTKIIGQLEKEVGLPLFDNIGRKIRLNKNGQVFFVYAKKVLGSVDVLQSEMDKLLDKREHSVRILSNMGSYSPELLSAFQIEYPNYLLSIDYASTKEIIEMLATGEADFAFCTPPIMDDPLKGIKTELVFCEYCCIMFPPDHPLLEKQRFSFEDLKDEPFVTTPRGSGLRTNIDRVCEKYGFTPQIVCESNDMNLITRMVRKGVGYAILPRWQVLSNLALAKYCVDVDVPEAKGYIGLSYNTDFNRGSAAESFKDFSKRFLTRFKESMYTDMP